MNKKKLNFGQYFVLTILLLVGFFCIKDFYVKNQISKHGTTIIAKFTSKEKKPKTTNFYFTYFINNKKYSTSNSGINYSILNSEKETQTIDSLKLDCFYLAKYLHEYPNIIIVNPSAEIKDSIKIKLAGF
jgi:hypothetical protein